MVFDRSGYPVPVLVVLVVHVVLVLGCATFCLFCCNWTSSTLHLRPFFFGEHIEHVLTFCFRNLFSIFIAKPHNENWPDALSGGTREVFYWVYWLPTRTEQVDKGGFTVKMERDCAKTKDKKMISDRDLEWTFTLCWMDLGFALNEVFSLM